MQSIWLCRKVPPFLLVGQSHPYYCCTTAQRGRCRRTSTAPSSFVHLPAKLFRRNKRNRVVSVERHPFPSCRIISVSFYPMSLLESTESPNLYLVSVLELPCNCLEDFLNPLFRFANQRVSVLRNNPCNFFLSYSHCSSSQSSAKQVVMQFSHPTTSLLSLM